MRGRGIGKWATARCILCKSKPGYIDKIPSCSQTSALKPGNASEPTGTRPSATSADDAPLAERIGMYEYMREMQLLAFQQLEPEAYETITGRLKQIREKADVEIDQINQTIAWEMEQAGLTIKISGREKHPYSIWKKMERKSVSPVSKLSSLMIACFKWLQRNAVGYGEERPA